jgi:DNA-binding GntR family transcriptional regulator
MIIVGVVESVIEYLREQIIAGELAPGQKLNEAQLAAEFNISRPPLREAFRILENDRLVVSVPRKGCYVRKISIEDLQKVFEARVMIESYAIDLFKKRNLVAIPEIASVFAAANEVPAFTWDAIDKKERLKYLKLLADFHTKVVEAADNNMLLHFHQTITYNLARYQYKYPYTPDSFRYSQEFHKQIMEQIVAGAFEQAKVTLETHLRTFVELLEKRMREEKLQERTEDQISV